MEQNYSETLSQNSLNPDSMLMLQIVGDDYELLALDVVLSAVYSKEGLKN